MSSSRRAGVRATDSSSADALHRLRMVRDVLRGAIVVVLALLLAGTVFAYRALADGSDAPTPYTVPSTTYGAPPRPDLPAPAATSATPGLSASLPDAEVLAATGIDSGWFVIAAGLVLLGAYLAAVGHRTRRGRR